MSRLVQQVEVSLLSKEQAWMLIQALLAINPAGHELFVDDRILLRALIWRVMDVEHL